jgi:Domain of unknown function (DUF4389)
MTDHPVRLVVEGDLGRRRVTVLFRPLFAIPHLIWFALWSVLTLFVAFVNWFATLVVGRPPKSLHGFICAYVRYAAHLDAYLWLVGNPYPGFMGEEGEYPIDIALPAPAKQPRLTVFFRLFLAIPTLLLASALGGSGGVSYSSFHGKRSYGFNGGALGFSVGVLGWFSSLARGRMPKGLRDAGAYSVGYSAQMLAYVLLVTDRYPNADPTVMLDGIDRPPEHVVRLVGDPHDLRRSRVTVFFRFPLALPHLVWISLWSIPVVFAVFVNWFVALGRGTPASSLHRFTSAYVRYRLHVTAFLLLAANPFPGFTGAAGSYPLDLELPPAARQNRWKTGFRAFLAIPALIVSSALSWGLLVAAFFTWFYALVRGSAPWGLRNLSAYALRYDAQTSAYVFLVTDAYPHASPLEGAPTPQHEFADVDAEAA